MFKAKVAVVSLVAMAAVFPLGASARGDFEAVSEEGLNSAVFFEPWIQMGGYDKREFSGGKWEQSFRKGTRSAELVEVATGDLNGDGVDDGAGVYWVKDAEGTTSYYLGAFVGKKGKVEQISIIPLQNSSDIGKVTITGGAVSVTLKTSAPDDSDSSPTLKQTMEFKLHKGKDLKKTSDVG